MSLMVDTPSTGLEQIQRQALLVLHTTLNEALGLVAEAWTASDAEIDTLTGREHVPTTLEPVLDTNFYEGLRPSLIKAPVTAYPNVAVMAYRAAAAPGSDQFDHQEKYRITLAVEIMVKASSEEGEGICNRRAHRMLDAAHVCMMANPTLGGIVSGYEGTPTSTISELIEKKDRGGDPASRGTRTSYGPTWFWQGGRLEYAVRKEAAMPSRGNNFRSVPTYSDLGNDQA